MPSSKLTQLIKICSCPEEVINTHISKLLTLRSVSVPVRAESYPSVSVIHQAGQGDITAGLGSAGSSCGTPGKFCYSKQLQHCGWSLTTPLTTGLAAALNGGLTKLITSAFVLHCTRHCGKSMQITGGAVFPGPPLSGTLVLPTAQTGVDGSATVTAIPCC